MGHPLVSLGTSLAAFIKSGLDLEGLYQTNFCRRSNAFCRLPISLMKPSKSNTILEIRKMFYLMNTSCFKIKMAELRLISEIIENLRNLKKNFGHFA